ncbi:hypothetical protein [[Eubacterium] cellulosolvens]
MNEDELKYILNKYKNMWNHPKIKNEEYISEDDLYKLIKRSFVKHELICLFILMRREVVKRNKTASLKSIEERLAKLKKKLQPILKKDQPYEKYIW